MAKLITWSVIDIVLLVTFIIVTPLVVYHFTPVFKQYYAYGTDYTVSAVVPTTNLTINGTMPNPVGWNALSQ